MNDFHLLVCKRPVRYGGDKLPKSQNYQNNFVHKIQNVHMHIFHMGCNHGIETPWAANISPLRRRMVVMQS